MKEIDMTVGSNLPIKRHRRIGWSGGRLISYLTKREALIVSKLMGGMRAKEIAWELQSSLHTVNTHLANIKQKLNCNNIFQLGLLLGKNVEVGGFEPPEAPEMPEVA